jgi:hypothetical protein
MTTMADRLLPAGTFLRFWIVLAFSYALLKFLFNIIVLGYIDLRLAVVEELFVLPLGQSIVLWWITRGGRDRPPA